MRTFPLPSRVSAGLRTLALATLLGGTTPSARAIPADPRPFVFTQPDGTKVTLYLRGDESHHWHEDTNAFTVVRDGGRFVYAATNQQRRLVATAWEVGKVDPQQVGLKPHVRSATRRLIHRNENLPMYRPWLSGGPAGTGGTAAEPGAVAGTAGDVALASTSARGTVRNLVVLCRFSDHTPGTHTRAQADYDVLFNRVGGDSALAPTGSVRDAYRENSYGLVDLQSTVLAWVTLPQNQAYYAGTEAGMGEGYPNNSRRMVEDALALVEPNVNFGDFDQDGDGLIDAITFIHSGYGAETAGAPANSIWSHRWWLESDWTSADNNRNGARVRVRDYHTEPALWGTTGTDIVRIGVICHELGHFFGLPDLYDTDNGANGTFKSSGIGAWCMMADSWGFDGTQLRPPHFSAWCKMQLGWVVPTPLTAAGNYSLGQAESGAATFKITTGFPAGEYLLVENRQRAGLDSTIPQGGLCVWHIDENVGGNSLEGYPGQAGWPGNGRHFKVALLQADGRYDLERTRSRGDAGDVFHAGGRNRIGADTIPNTHSYQGGNVHPTGIELCNISSAGATMTFRFVPESGVFVDADSRLPLERGTCELPFNTLREGHAAALDRQTIFLRGSGFPESRIDLTKRVTLRIWDGPITIR